jgi:hypothetical protein
MGAVAPALILTTGCTPLASPAIESGSTQSGAPQPASPSGGPSATPAKPAVVPASRRWKPGARQYGLQVYAHTANGKPASANIDGILDYAVERGANSVAFSFPLYTDGQRPTRVYAGAETPSPKVVAAMVAAAHARGLRVMVRPLLDEENLRTSSGGWRGTIRPKSLDGWFRSYTAALTPYLQAASAAKADEFVLASELTSLQKQHGQWRSLSATAAKAFPATLSYTFNFDIGDPMPLPPKGAAGLDLYFAVDLGPEATVPQLAAALRREIMAMPKPLRNVMVAQEVGISAENDAYRHPWNWGSQTAKQLNPKIQVNWFSAACRAVEQSDLKGIYFWMLDSSMDPKEIDPSTEGSAGFVGRPGEKAIEQCFAGRS